MGIDAGLFVTRQLTDQAKWARAMEEVRERFRGSSCLRELQDPQRVIDLDGAPRGDRLLPALCHLHARLQEPGVVARIAKLAAESERGGWQHLDALELTEPMNFGAAARGGAHWETLLCVGDGPEDVLAATEEWCEADAPTAWAIVTGAPDAFARHACLEERTLGYPRVSGLWGAACAEVPLLLELTVWGQRLHLPVFARHFTGAAVQVPRGGRLDVEEEDKLRQLGDVMRAHFPHNSVYFYYNDKYAHATEVAATPVEDEDRAHFYRRLRGLSGLSFGEVWEEMARAGGNGGGGRGGLT